MSTHKRNMGGRASAGTLSIMAVLIISVLMAAGFVAAGNTLRAWLTCAAGFCIAGVIASNEKERAEK